MTPSSNPEKNELLPHEKKVGERLDLTAKQNELRRKESRDLTDQIREDMAKTEAGRAELAKLGL